MLWFGDPLFPQAESGLGIVEVRAGLACWMQGNSWSRVAALGLPWLLRMLKRPLRQGFIVIRKQRVTPTLLTQTGAWRRCGVIVVELILSFPILFLLMLAVVEFAILMDNMKHVSLASRNGAKIAAETPGLGGFTDPPLTNNTAATIRATIDRQLNAAGFGDQSSQGVTLRHTVGAGYVATDGTAADPNQIPMPANAVRVTVAVPVADMTPDFLTTFGFSTSERVVELTTTLPYEQ